MHICVALNVCWVFAVLLKASFACEWQTSVHPGCTCTSGSELMSWQLEYSCSHWVLCHLLMCTLLEQADTCGLMTVCFWEHPRMCRGAYMHLLCFLTLRWAGNLSVNSIYSLLAVAKVTVPMERCCGNNKIANRWEHPVTWMDKVLHLWGSTNI